MTKGESPCGQKQPKYYQLMTDLNEKVTKGEIRPGDKLPSENELSAAYQISRQTVRKALAVLDSEGYIYAEHGRGTFCRERVMHTGNSKNIAVVTTYLSDYIFPRVIQGIDEVLTREGYSIILKNTKNSRSQEAKCLEELLQKDIEGIIIEPSKSHIYCRHTELYGKLEEYGIPYVFIQGCFDQFSEKSKVLMDDCLGGYLITKYLIETGHRNIIGVFKSDDMQGQNRHRGYVQALQDMEKRVPEDISVTGYDNSFMAAGDGFHLTTIVHPQEKLGEMAAELLLDLIHHREGLESEQILIEPELVIGNSCLDRR